MLFPVKAKRGDVVFIRLSSIFYIEADGGDILIRTRAKHPLRSCERIGEAAKRLTQRKPVLADSSTATICFFRCHRSYIVNLERVRRLRVKGPDSYALKLAPPVNKWIPLSEDRYRVLKRQVRF
jgi:DNA-binding LytR/AlgR family response regulator